MYNINESSASFAMNVNVHIEVQDKMGRIVKNIDKHNRATVRMLSGILSFLKGNFTTTYRRSDVETIRKINDAKNYIPCYMGAGIYGIRTAFDGLPDYDENNRRLAPTLPELENEIVQFSDTKLKQEITVDTRYPIAVVDPESLYKQGDDNFINVNVGDCVQCVMAADVDPGHFNKAYGKMTDIFITELGLFATNISGDDTLLARVVLKGEDILYVRPQDTIILRWTICLISLNDQSQSRNYDSDTYTDVDDNVAPGLTITNEEEDNNG